MPSRIGLNRVQPGWRWRVTFPQIQVLADERRVVPGILESTANVLILVQQCAVTTPVRWAAVV